MCIHWYTYVCTYINLHICIYLFTWTIYITYRWYSSILGPQWSDRSHTSTSSVGMFAESPLGVEALEHVSSGNTGTGWCLTVLLFKNWTFLSIINFGWCSLKSLSSLTHAHKFEKPTIFMLWLLVVDRWFLVAGCWIKPWRMKGQIAIRFTCSFATIKCFSLGWY